MSDSLTALLGYISIHLMLLFIDVSEELKTVECNFNTSHVTVYQKRTHMVLRDTYISIHLMLLFIGPGLEKEHGSD